MLHHRPDNPPSFEWYSVVPALLCEGLSLAAFGVSCLLLNSTALREMVRHIRRGFE